MITIETADSALKSYYLDAVKDALDYKVNPFLAKVSQSTVDVVGKDVRKYVRTGISGGIGAGTETGDLPKAKEANRVQLVSTLKNLYATLEISDKALRASASNEGAFVNLLNDEMQTLVKGATYHFGRMLFGNGTGLVADTRSASGNRVSAYDVKNLVEGMVVDFYYNDEPIEGAQKRTIVAVDRVEKTFTVDGASLNSVSDNWEDCQVYVHDGKDNELTGLYAIFDEMNLYGLSKDDYSFLRPYIERNMGDIDENRIQYAIDIIEETSGSKVNMILCSWGVKRALMQHYKDFGMKAETMQLDNGEQVISFNGIPVIADRFCPQGTMYLLNTDDFKLHQLCDWKWLEGEDGKILKQIPGKPVYTATLVKYAELMCERPCAQGMIVDIMER